MSEDRPDFEDARRRMVKDQLERRGVRDRRVLEAMGRVPRENFVPPELQRSAYADRALLIGCDQTISQPLIVALMTEALQLEGSETVLEVGTGSGYQAAVLAELAAEVVTVERHESLAQESRQRLEALGYRNIEFHVGDGTRGWSGRAPFDRILVTAATPRCPEPLIEQLAERGILVIPLGPGDGQMLTRLRKTGGRISRENLGPCRFVPLIGDDGGD